MEKGSGDPLFEIETQSASSISNVGGNQNVYLGVGRSRAAAIGRRAAALGLALFFGGLVLLVATVVLTTRHVLADLNADGITSPYTHYIAGSWTAAVALLAAGLVLMRFGRLYASR